MGPTIEIFPENIENRRIESLTGEKSLLVVLQRVYRSLIEQGHKTAPSKPEAYLDNLKQNLKEKFDQWQYFQGGEQGLNSGASGEIFTRFTALGITSGMPIVDMPQDAPPVGTQVVEYLRNKDDIGRFKIITYVGRSTDESRVVSFEFATSLSVIDDRLQSVNEEIDAIKSTST